MSWTPTQDLEITIGQLFDRARSTASRRANKALSDLAELRAFDGQSMTIPTIRLREEELRTTIETAIDETFDLFTQIYGTFPPEAAGWVRQYFTERIDRLSETFGRGLAGLHSRPEARLAREGVRGVAAGLKRDLEIRLAPIEIRDRLRNLAAGTLLRDRAGQRKFDAFISHASEDLAAVTQPLFDRLSAEGYHLWLDRVELKVGMSLFNSIDDGLGASRFGVLILSPSFFAKSWPRRELGALAALADTDGRPRLLPVWHELTRDDVASYSPLLADILSVSTRDGLENVIVELKRAIGPPQTS